MTTDKRILKAIDLALNPSADLSDEDMDTLASLYKDTAGEELYALRNGKSPFPLTTWRTKSEAEALLEHYRRRDPKWDGNIFSYSESRMERAKLGHFR